MNSKPTLAELAKAQLQEYAFGIGVLTVARLIGTKKLDPELIKDEKTLFRLLQKLGKSSETAFEVHTDRVPGKINGIKACIECDEHESAVVLLFTLIEGEVNTALQILLRIRGFSNSAISGVLRGADLSSKLNVLLPLLGVDPGARIRQLASESQSIRNACVHYKAKPAIWWDSEASEGDDETIKKKALEFIGRNPLKEIQLALISFVDLCVAQCPEYRTAHELLHKFKQV